jgi:hypothetical protein
MVSFTPESFVGVVEGSARVAWASSWVSGVLLCHVRIRMLVWKARGLETERPRGMSCVSGGNCDLTRAPMENVTVLHFLTGFVPEGSGIVWYDLPLGRTECGAWSADHTQSQPPSRNHLIMKDSHNWS